MIAEEYDISFEKLNNLITSESEWNPVAVSPTGDYGLAAINLRWNPDVTEEQAFDPEFAIRFAANVIKEGKEDELYTVCNCYTFVRVLTGIKGPVTPSTSPYEGAIAIFDYDGVPHYAVVVELKLDGFVVREANYEDCKTGKRFVKWDDKALKGFSEGKVLE